MMINPYRYAAAIQLGWQSPVAISGVGNTIVSTSGTLIAAKNAGSAADKTVNGVTFVAAASIGTSWTGYSISTMYQDGGVSADFEAVLDSISYYPPSSSGSFILSGLTAGKTYQLQVFISDDRAGLGTVTQFIVLGSYTSSSVLNATSYSRICNFVAGASTQTVTINASLGNAFINGFQVRQLD
jgi:hypothetical protein